MALITAQIIKLQISRVSLAVVCLLMHGIAEETKFMLSGGSFIRNKI